MYATDAPFRDGRPSGYNADFSCDHLMNTALAGNLTHPSGARTECVHYKGA